jgi:hypothetical protein
MLIVFAILSSAAVIGAVLKAVLPQQHLSTQSKDTVDRGLGILATLAALVLGLLVASAKDSFDTKADEIQQAGANIILIDRNLRHYGEGNQDARSALQSWVRGSIQQAQLSNAAANGIASVGGNSATLEELQDKLRALTPINDAQRWIQTRVLQLSADVAGTRWLLYTQSISSIQGPFLIVLVFWLAIIFGSLGLFAPRNATVYAITFVCAFSVSSAVFLILELDSPYGGFIRVSDIPLRNALTAISQ